MAVLHEHSMFVNEFKSALQTISQHNYKVVMYKVDRKAAGQQGHRYNVTVMSEVTVEMAGNEFGTRDTVIRKYDETLAVSYTHLDVYKRQMVSKAF